MLKYSNTIKQWVIEFIVESNSIENIGIGLLYDRSPTSEEVNETFRFIKLEKITLEDLQKFITICQAKNSYNNKKTRLRDKKGLNVSVGNYQAPKGGAGVLNHLEDFLESINENKGDDIFSDPFLAHKEYESLHPFTDCNGRTGRIIWLWQMLKLKKKLAPGGFLQTWYYNSLNENRNDG